MRYSTAPSSVMFATVRIKRSPIGNKRIAFMLRASYALPVHIQPLAEMDVALAATTQDLHREVEALCSRFNCRSVQLDVAGDVAKIIARNDLCKMPLAA